MKSEVRTPAFGKRNISLSGRTIFSNFISIPSTKKHYKKRKSCKNLFVLKSPCFSNERARSLPTLNITNSLAEKRKDSGRKNKMDLLELLKYGVYNCKTKNLRNKPKKLNINGKGKKSMFYQKMKNEPKIFSGIIRKSNNEVHQSLIGNGEKKRMKRKEIFFLNVKRRNHKLKKLFNIDKNLGEFLERSYREDKEEIFEKIYRNTNVIDKKFVKKKKVKLIPFPSCSKRTKQKKKLKNILSKKKMGKAASQKKVTFGGFFYMSNPIKSSMSIKKRKKSVFDGISKRGKKSISLRNILENRGKYNSTPQFNNKF